MSAPVMRLLNLPWTYTRSDLVRYLNRALNTRVRFSRVLYDKQTGLSRGIALIQLENDDLAKNLIRKGTLEVDGRTSIVLRADSKTEARLSNARAQN